MGGDANHSEIVQLAKWLRDNTQKKVAMYSGDENLDNDLIKVLDYYKSKTFLFFIL